MAVIGRQRPKPSMELNLASQATMAASAMAMFNSANIRADSASDSPCEIASFWAVSFQWPGGVTVPAPSAQNRAICVWSGVRTVLLAAPKSLTSLNSAAYWPLVRVGGPDGRNCAPLVMANGVTLG